VGNVWDVHQTAPNAGWSEFSNLGGELNDEGFGGNCAFGTVAAGRNKDGRLEIFGLDEGAGRVIKHIWQVAPNGGWTSTFVSVAEKPAAGFSEFRGDPVVSSNKDGRLEVFGAADGGNVWHSWQNAPNSGWAAYADLGGNGEAALNSAGNADGRLEAFDHGANDEISHNWQTSPGGGWFGFVTLFGSPAEYGSC
jgi:hypothetical protein